MRADKKTRGLVLETFGEQHITYVGALRSKHIGLSHFIREHGYTGTDTRTAVRPRPYSPMRGYTPEAVALPPLPERAKSPELLLPDYLSAPAIMSLGFVVVMNPLIAQIRGVETAQARQMLELYWQNTPNEDSMF